MKKLYYYFVEQLKSSAKVVLKIVLSKNLKKQVFVFLTTAIIFIVNVYLFNHCYHENVLSLHDFFHLNLHSFDFSKVRESAMIAVEVNSPYVHNTNRLSRFIVKHFKKISVYNLYLFMLLNLHALFVNEFTLIGAALHIVQAIFQVMIEMYFHHISHGCKSRMVKIYDVLSNYFNPKNDGDEN